MTQQAPPDMERIKQRAAKVQEICKKADAEILILDDLIAQLEEKIRASPLYRYRRHKAKRLLCIESDTFGGDP